MPSSPGAAVKVPRSSLSLDSGQTPDMAVSEAAAADDRTNESHHLLLNERVLHTPNPHQEPLSTLQILRQLTLNEKLLLLTGSSLWTLHGVDRLHIPSLTVSDGGHGVRKPLQEMSLQEAYPATCFPPYCALACSWDPDLAHRMGAAIRQECLHYNISVLLGPGLNLKRHPCGGRNFEYFSEDPLLSGLLAAAFIRGVQETNQVAACPKHFCINNQETHRFVVNAMVDPRTGYELYYKAFEIMVKQSQPATIMCAYNKVNGVYASENKFLQTTLLRETWGFEGVCMTDWGATNDRVAAIAAGMDLEMPGSHLAHDRDIKAALDNGTLTMDAIDTCALRVLNLIDKYKGARTARVPVQWEEHAKLARQVARDCIVLLKNDDNILPLAKHTSVALIGDFAKDHPRIQGMGSAQVTAYQIETVYDEIKHFTDQIFFAKGYDGNDDHPTELNRELLDEAVQVAKEGVVVLLCIGLPEIMESEGMDREHMCLPAQHQALLDEVAAVNPNVVVLLTNGGAVQLPDTYYKAKAILEGYLLGQAGGGAICDILFGVQAPCGKLAETMPVQLEDVLCDKYFPGDRDTVGHLEGLDVGYRYFDTSNVPVRYPFGHGMSYTTFEFSNLQTTIERDEVDQKLVNISLDLKNTGSMGGKEVVQVYVRDIVASVYRPAKELKFFTKISLEPGESKTVHLSLETDAFAFWDIGRNDWVVEPGEFEIQIGSSSHSIALRQTITFKSGHNASIVARESYPPVKNGTLQDITAELFAKRFGPESSVVLNEIHCHVAPTIFTRNSLLKEVAKVSLLGKLLFHIVYTEASREVQPGQSEQRQKKMVLVNVENLPLRVLVLFSKGGLSFTLLDAIIATFNGHYLSAVKHLTYASLYAVSDTIAELSGYRKP